MEDAKKLKEEEKKMPKPTKATFEFLGSYIKKYKKLFSLGFTFQLISTLNWLATPTVIGIVIDKLTKAEYDDINVLAWWYLLLVSVSG